MERCVIRRWHAMGRSLAIGSLGLLLGVAGCADRAQTLDDLDQALSDTHAAVRSAVVVLEQRATGRTTRAVTVTTVENVLEQAADAQRTLADVSAGSPDEQQLRRSTMQAVSASVEVLVEVVEAASADRDTTAIRQRLIAADENVGRTLQIVQGSR